MPIVVGIALFMRDRRLVGRYAERHWRRLRPLRGPFRLASALVSADLVRAGVGTRRGSTCYAWPARRQAQSSPSDPKKDCPTP
jgi:hypothetical protein